MNDRSEDSDFHAPTRLRGHHFLCLYGFRGLGYSDGFINNMTAVLRRIQQEPERPLEAVQVVDCICQACPHLFDARCNKKGTESEARVREHDERILRRLGIMPGQILPASQFFRKIEQHILPEDLLDLCKGCGWLVLGFCQEGLRSRRMLTTPPEQADAAGTE